jgi:hypothetical protein
MPLTVTTTANYTGANRVAGCGTGTDWAGVFAAAGCAERNQQRKHDEWVT